MTALRHDHAVGPGTGHGLGQGHGRGHGWMMIACCIPMLVIAVILVATGVASPGFPGGRCRLHADDGADDMSHGGRDGRS